LPCYFALFFLSSADVPVSEGKGRNLVVLENCPVEPVTVPDAVPKGSYTQEEFNQILASAGFTGATFTGPRFEVYLSPSGPTRPVTPVDPSDPSAGPPFVAGTNTYAEFDTLVSMVSVDIGDYNADAEDLHLDAFNEANELIAQDFFSNPRTSSDFHRLMVEAPGIKRVQFLYLGDISRISVLGCVQFLSLLCPRMCLR